MGRRQEYHFSEANAGIGIFFKNISREGLEYMSRYVEKLKEGIGGWCWVGKEIVDTSFKAYNLIGTRAVEF